MAKLASASLLMKMLCVIIPLAAVFSFLLPFQESVLYQDLHGGPMCNCDVKAIKNGCAKQA